MAGELGVNWIHIPIVDHRGTNDRAAEDAISDLLDKAAAVLADPANQPVFFHCHHGLNRTSMVQIAYRTKYCGWTFEQATDEIDRTIGLVKVRHGPDYRHMVSFYENRVLPLRRPTAQRPLKDRRLSRPASIPRWGPHPRPGNDRRLHGPGSVLDSQCFDNTIVDRLESSERPG